jgi:hypothetical protein
MPLRETTTRVRVCDLPAIDRSIRSPRGRASEVVWAAVGRTESAKTGEDPQKVRTQQQVGWRVAPMLIAARHSAGMGCSHC